MHYEPRHRNLLLPFEQVYDSATDALFTVPEKGPAAWPDGVYLVQVPDIGDAIANLIERFTLSDVT